MTVLCPYCGDPAELVTGDALYPHRSDLSHKKAFRCVKCGAWVGCHPGTDKPMGRLANAELRAAKIKAHAAFDPLWTAKIKRDGISKGEARGRGYHWLAAQMGIEQKDCHIGMFDVGQCELVVEICAPFLRRVA